ncbi:zinc-ribbon domain-containing protein [Pseudooceanicola sp. C21-150M6]|uniref:zinc-ribbon domain-containing protein n=1 Tax=Pseudooceanicola sp. C21-150M6 TaxID=3434355 RepID=UPI003D7F75E5
MRLTCPNCGAQYEVPDEVIPESGRDVQCSNCGDTWFQPHPSTLDAEAWDEDLSEAAADDFEDGDYDEDYGDEEWQAPPAPALRQRNLAPEVKSILREEAAVEEKARAGDPLESQPDLGLDEPVTSRRPAATAPEEDPAPEKPSLRLTPEEKAAMAAQDRPVSRRNLLPDIDELSSTLRRRGEGGRRGEPRKTTPLVQARRRGFRRGFMLSLIVVLVAAIIYLQAPKISAALPPLASPLAAYVSAVDRGRLWLDERARALVIKLDDWTGAAEQDPDAAPATE